MAGADLHRHVLQQLDKVAGSVFYLGASQRTLTHITERIHAEHPHIRVNTYSPPYRDRFSEEETAAMIAAVNAFKPDVLFVGMTAPKQEKWIAANRHLLQARLISGIGAVFGFLRRHHSPSSPMDDRHGTGMVGTAYQRTPQNVET
ncbi:WecB/TagA/CpsF family glycosyltransferase [Bacteroides salyersiae]|nr:WecB/TagA/CpsF family glycosyltransferase [Bacteroides salyersiae]